MYITDGFVMRNNTHILLNINSMDVSIKFVLSLLNSQLINFYYQLINPEKGEALAEVKAFHLENLPIKNIPLEQQQPFIEKADQMLSLNKELQEISGKFQRNLQREFSLEKLSKKLESWFDLSYDDFLKELKKLKVELTLSQKAEWEDYFLQEKAKALDCQSNIQATDKKIDQMVYQLYGLTEEEIGVVKNS